MPAAALPAIIGGLQAAGSIGSTIGANVGNKKFAREMYRQQYRDNIDFWRMQNEYNSPSSQMQRLREAGLNPAMIYGGQGSGAAGQAGNIASPGTPKVDHKVPDLSGLAELQNNMRQSKLVDAQVDLLGAQKLKTIADASRSKFDLGIRNEIREYLAEAGKLEVAKLKSQISQIDTQTTTMLSADMRAALKNTQDLRIGMEKILTMQAERENIPWKKKQLQAAVANMRKDATMKELEIALRRSGVTFNDELWQRLAALGINAVHEKDGGKALGKSIMESLRDLIKF
ncbi:hypothetical protein [Eel River basin pequenovirus]|nr:hypothetical protein [Eel River basin pequenovirus]